jgi:hypothetical protein
MQLLFVILTLLSLDVSTAFSTLQQSNLHHTINQRRSSLFGLSEWRDTDFDLPASQAARPLGAEQGPLPKSVCILPFGFDEVLLQGETKQLRLYEDRFLKLFDDSIENHAGVVAMGLLAESGIIQTVPLCEIESHVRMDGFGIFVTIRCVGRAQLQEITQKEPYLKAICTELSDKLPPNLELPNLLASNIEEMNLWLTSSERRLHQAKQQQQQQQNATESWSGDNSDDQEMQRRITIAKLEDRFYSDATDKEEDDEEEEDDEVESDRLQRFRTAYQVALDTDTQGYQLFNQDTGDRTARELTAISWAAFCTEIVPEQDAMFRVQALDTDNLFDRLKLAVYMLREKKKRLAVQIEKSGLKGSDFDEDVRS